MGTASPNIAAAQRSGGCRATRLWSAPRSAAGWTRFTGEATAPAFPVVSHTGQLPNIPMPAPCISSLSRCGARPASQRGRGRRHRDRRERGRDVRAFRAGGIVRYRPPGRPLFTARAARARAFPAACATTGHWGDARWRIQFRYFGDRGGEGRQIQLSGRAAGDSGQGGTDRTCLYCPWRRIAHGGAAFRLGPSGCRQRGAGGGNAAGGRAQRGRIVLCGAGGALERFEGRTASGSGRAGTGGGWLMRIDAHHHLWSLAWGNYGWLTSELAPIYRDFGLADLAPHLAAAGIEGTILVQAAATEAETLFLLDIAESSDVVRGVVGRTDFDAANGAARIDALAARKLLVGLRPMLQDIHDDDWLLGPALAPLLTAMVRNGLVFDALVLPRHLPRLLRVIDSHPDLEFVLDHCGKPRLATGEIAIWRRDVALLAEHPNIVCKLSGLVTEAVPDWQIADLRQAVDHVRGCFGPQRMLWGSDWPVVNLAGGYARWLAAAETLLADLSPDEQADIFGGNAARIYLSSRGRRTC